MPTTFSEWTSIVQILALLLGALGVVTGMRAQVGTLSIELRKLSSAVEDLRRVISMLDRRVSYIEGLQAGQTDKQRSEHRET